MRANCSWVIGAAADCNVVVSAPTVSSRHCRLVRAGDGVVLEDLGSTNGTFLNDRAVTTATRVSTEDHIRLGQEVLLSLSVGELLRQMVEESPVRGATEAFRQISTRNKLIASVTLSLLLLFVAIQLGRASVRASSSPAIDSQSTQSRPGQPSMQPATLTSDSSVVSVPQQTPTSAESQAETKSEPTAKSDGSRTRESSDQRVANSDRSLTTSATRTTTTSATVIDPRQALYAVLVRESESALPEQIGTAWAATDRSLVTSGSVVQSLKIMVNATAVTVRCEASGQEFPVIGMAMHAEYSRWLPEIEAAFGSARRLNDRLESIERQKQSPPTTLEREFAEAVTRMNNAVDQSAFFNIGTLRVESELPTRLPISEVGVTQALKTPISLIGGGPRADEKTASLRTMLTPESLLCDRGLKLNWNRERDSVFRWQWSSLTEHSPRDWRGSPVLNGAGHVIAVFARPRPPQNPEEGVSRHEFDAVSVEQLRSLLPELFEQGK